MEIVIPYNYDYTLFSNQYIEQGHVKCLILNVKSDFLILSAPLKYFIKLTSIQRQLYI